MQITDCFNTTDEKRISMVLECCKLEKF